mmetsp:Transcript_5278/g.9690  ORF Transcript_5278/g.9690 Transcript_5278/m.9690 type:complete len:294 (+) Transcript_5278:1058-1939(+)
MSKGYSKFTVPEVFMKYGGPAISGFYLIFLLICLTRLATDKEMRRSIKVIFVMCCIMLFLSACFWMDYYANYPIWLYAILEFWHCVLEVTVIERLASSWLTIYKRHLSMIEGHSTYSKKIQRFSMIFSIAFQVSFALLFVLLFLFDQPDTRDICRLYFGVVELFYFIPYLIYSALKLNHVIKQYLEISYSLRVNFICIFSVVSMVFRIVSIAYFSIRSGEDVRRVDSDGYLWASVILFFVLVIIDFGFMMTIFAVLLARGRSKESVVSSQVACNLTEKLYSREGTECDSDNYN